MSIDLQTIQDYREELQRYVDGVWGKGTIEIPPPAPDLEEKGLRNSLLDENAPHTESLNYRHEYDVRQRCESHKRYKEKDDFGRLIHWR